jgi:hypothetical protein
MLVLQAPGSFLVVFFQAFEYKHPPSFWLPFLFTGVQQVVLLGLCVYLVIKKRRSTPKEEEKPLLVNENEFEN